MKNYSILRNKALAMHKFFIVATLLLTSTVASSQTAVNSLTELLPYLSQDNVNVKLTAGTYEITATDITNGTFSDYYTINGNKAYVLFLFTGNNSTYDFTDVTVNIKTEVFNAIPSDAGDFYELQTIGNDNVIKGLTMVDVGTVDDFPKYGCVNVVMDGARNRIEDFHITAKGSYPYGYGDAFGKGGTNNTIAHKKHSAFLIRGESNHAKNNTLIHRSYGHCMFMQAANNPLIEGCFIEGEVRSTDDMLAETEGPAYDIDFFTTWGYRLPPGYMLSTGEAGIRAYNGGQTIVDGVEYSRTTSNVTVKNCTIKYMRTGVTIAHASGTKYVEGCTAIGCENGYSLGSGDVVDCYADCAYGPVYSSTYESDKNYNAEITIIPAVDEYYNGSGSVAYIGGSGHNITLKGSEVVANQDLKIKVGGDKNNIRLLYGNLPHQNDFEATNFTLNNLTNFPVFLSEKSSNLEGQSGGMITDWGTNNNIVYTAVSVKFIEAENYTDMSGISTEVTTDDNDGENVTSIEAGDWLEYEIDIPYSGTYNMDYRVASASVNGEFVLSVGAETLETVSFNATGGAQTWETVRSETAFYLTKGIQTLKITANSADWNINWLDLSLECADIEIDPYYETFNAIGNSLGVQHSSEVSIFTGNSISLQPEPQIGGIWTWTGPNGFTADTRIVELSYVQDDVAGDYNATITNDCGQQSSITYKVVVSDDLLVEAETFTSDSGVTTEVTTDVDGGENVTSIVVDSWMEYSINVPFSATYLFDYRVASESTDGDFTVAIDNEDVDQITFSATGGEQVWSTISSTELIYLTEGEHTFRIKSNSADWKMNWLKLVGQDYVSPCNLPFVHQNVMVQNSTVSWTSGLMDITCATNINVYIEMSEMGTLSDNDILNVYYKLDSGDLIPISENTGNLNDDLEIIRELRGTTLEVIIEGESTSTDNYYVVDKITVVESTDPFARIEAENYNAMEGVSTGDRLGSINPGNWSMYSGLDITGAISIDASVGSIYSDAYIEVRLDSIDGRLIGTIEVPNTGNWNTYRTASTYIDGVTGVYDVYLVYQALSSPNVCNFDWFQFSDVFIKRPTNPYERFEAEINDGESGITVVSTSDVDGDEELSDLADGDYVKFSALNLGEAVSIDARISANLAGGTIEVRVGTINGKIISFIDVPDTGSEWETINTLIGYTEGENDIYFVFRGEGTDLFRVNWFQFHQGERDDDEIIAPFSRIEAESYSRAFGTETATTTDTDGEEEVSFSQNNEWLLFKNVDMTEAVTVDLRVASQSGGLLYLYSGAYDGSYIGVVSIPSTGSLSDWETISGNLLLEGEGVKDIYVILKGAEGKMININWLEFVSASTDIDNSANSSGFNLYPNPIVDFFTIEGAFDSKVEVFNIGGEKVLEEVILHDKMTISMRNFNRGTYVVRVQNGSTSKVFKIIKQ